MSSVLRLSSGDVIQIREGVLEGIGPQGPTGPSGPQGLTGPVGAQGIPGPMGQIDDFFTYAHNIGNAQSIGTGVVTTVSFPTVVYDEPSLVASLTNLAIPVGLWHVLFSVVFAKPSSSNASGWRRIGLQYNGSESAAGTINSIPDIDSQLNLHTFVKATSAGLTLTGTVSHSDVVSLAATVKIYCTRVGPGAQGVAGPQGSTGVAGPVGPTGPQGPAGALVTNTTTYASIGG